MSADDDGATPFEPEEKRGMIFSVTAGSSGSGKERYALRLPISFMPGYSLTGLELDHSLPVLGTEARLVKEGAETVLLLGPLDSAASAAQLLEPLRCSLQWLSIRLRRGIRTSGVLQHARLSEEPTAVTANNRNLADAVSRGWTAIDGDYEANGSAVVIPEHKRLIRFATGGAKVTTSNPVSEFLSGLQELASKESLSDVVASPKLRLAAEIYASSYWDVTTVARFVRLVTALEALVARRASSSVVKREVEKGSSLFKSARDVFSKDSPEFDELNRALQRLKELEKESISSGIRHFARRAAEAIPRLGAPADVSKQIKTYYDLRSTLLHTGKVADEAVREGERYLSGFMPVLLDGLLERPELVTPELA